MGESFKPPAPVRNPETEQFWDAAREGKLFIKQCNACGATFFYPRSLCPFCMSETSWIESSGAGTVYSYTSVYNREGSYVLALVTLAEGPTIMTNVLTKDADSVTVGQLVRVEFQETTGEDPVPVFVPA